MKTKLLALALLAGGSLFAETRFSIGIHIGGNAPGYYAPPAYAAVRPPCPGPDYVWTDGYWDQGSGRRNWVNGFWNRRPSFRAFDHDRGRYQRGRDFNRDDNRGRGNSFGNGFRNR